MNEAKLTPEQTALVEENYRLVWSIVNRFRYHQNEKDDLFQSGCVGLIMAAKKFDPTRGFAFSTFAVPYILGEIRQYLQNRNPIKLSKQALKISRRIREYLERHQRLSIKELAKRLKLDYEEVVLGYHLMESWQPLSLEYTIDDHLTVGDYVLKDNSDVLESEQIILSEWMKGMSELERKVFYYRFRYGLTQSEIGKKLGISQSKVSRIEKRIVETIAKYYRLSS